MLNHIEQARLRYHVNLSTAGVLGLRNGIPTMADKDSTTSRDIAMAMVQIIDAAVRQAVAAQLIAASATPLVGPTSLSGQSLGKHFTDQTEAFLQECFDALSAVRPGPWHYATEQRIAKFDQYAHLAQLSQIAEELRSILGADYVVKPDIVISREPLPDGAFGSHVIDPSDPVAKGTSLRATNRPHGTRILHASVSCKWTMRSDRAQNTRTEALNLIRLRKGRTPIIVAITGEPLPTRLASLALGTGDIDRVYHFALYELEAALQQVNNQDQADMLSDLIAGNRLADISDLPFDLAI